MRLGVTANTHRVGAKEALTAVQTWGKLGGHELILCDDLKPIATDHTNFCKDTELPAKSDFIVSMGGDGTILNTARAVGSSGVPILGINLGSLGFLTQRTPAQIGTSLDAIVAGNFQIEERMLLKAVSMGRFKLSVPYALNDVVIDRGPSTRLLDINLRVNGEEVVTYKADGLIIATPTGSTAYSLAVGGPIIHPKNDNMIAAPIAPFSLTTRPMIFSGDDIIELQLMPRPEEAHLTLDGQIGIAIRSGELIRISRAEYRVKFVTFPESSYYKLLRNKLHWGVPPNFRA
ncbi:MAG: NAD(+)/NADH kinase [Candidatus Zixiibacteriota bacterium]